MSKQYALEFDAAGKCDPVVVRARLRFAGSNEKPVPLMKSFEVSDDPGAQWLKKGLLLIDGKQLAEQETVAEITMKFTDKNMSLTDFVNLTRQRPVVCPLQVTLQPNVAITAPGMGLSITLPNVPLYQGITGSYSILLHGWEARLEVKIDSESLQAEGKEGIEVYARVALPGNIDATADELKTIQKSIAFTISPTLAWESDGEITEQGDWLVKRFRPLKGNETTVAKSSENQVTVMAKVGTQTLKHESKFRFAPVQGWLEVRPAELSLKVDGKDQAPFYAFLVLKDPKAWKQEEITTVLGTLQASLDSTGARWLDLSSPSVGNDYAGWNVFSLDPAPVKDRRPPDAATVTVKGDLGEHKLKAQCKITLVSAPAGVLTLDTQSVTLCRGSNLGDQIKITARVDNAGTANWGFSAHFETPTPNDPSVNVVKEGNQAGIWLLARKSDATGSPGPHWEEARTLIVEAQSGAFTLPPQTVQVSVVSEGLLILDAGRSEAGYYPVRADGSKDTKLVRFQVWQWQDGKLVNNLELVRNLKFTWEADPKVYDALESTGQLQSEYDSEDYWKFWLEKMLPGQGEVLRANYVVTVEGLYGDAFTKNFVIGIVPLTDDPESAAAEKEYEGTKKIINDVIPISYRGDFLRKLEQAHRTMGAKGLYEWRHKMWKSAYQLTLGDDAVREGYLNEGNWAGRIENALTIADILGDIALRALARRFNIDPTHLDSMKKVLVCFGQQIDLFAVKGWIPEGEDMNFDRIMTSCVIPIVRGYSWRWLSGGAGWATDLSKHSKSEWASKLLPVIIYYWGYRVLFRAFVERKDWMTSVSESTKDTAKMSVGELLGWAAKRPEIEGFGIEITNIPPLLNKMMLF